jgi:hypothetical protein
MVLLAFEFIKNTLINNYVKKGTFYMFLGILSPDKACMYVSFFSLSVPLSIEYSYFSKGLQLDLKII